ncbi:GTP-binding protein [Microbulbifer thermotolerans]|uniref:CobW family GTP-binding protein n=1 Tax=Microbulbifer thermotolerans TaxID=252514 RepID=UPI00267154F1|nr:GTP-binding protein [Microbulbifer thermotolerans]WKT62208.1 GTP-binding protein [Microbulbifer thermotolerans]
MQIEDPIRQVPANVITGFLGVGKTTAIRHLLDNKPIGERWAVLVNEFGEIGVDGSLFGSENDGEVFIREVPGGCMCCTAGLPMQVALNQLLRRARPQRLLIEPTGLGHPREVLTALSEAASSGVLDLRATLTLVDARCLADERYLSNDTFRQQLEVADLVVANKSDLYGPRDLEALRRFLSSSAHGPTKPLKVVEQGRLLPEWLHSPSGFTLPQAQTHTHATHPEINEQPIPECGYLRLEHSGEGFHSCGWRFDPTLVFDFHKLFSLISGIGADRVKGVFITQDGVFGFNKADSVLSVLELDDISESRVEVIDAQPGEWTRMESAWLEALSAA